MATSASGRELSNLCVFYQKGWCKSGAGCRFTHGTSDKRWVTGGSTEVSAGARAGASPSTGERCKFFAKGMCMRGETCIFVHSRDAAAKDYHPNSFAGERPAKRLAPGTQTSPRPVVYHGTRTDVSAGVRGRRAVQEVWNAEGASSASGGGGGGGGDSSHADTGDRGSSAGPWQPPANDDSGYFFEGDAGFGGAGAAAALPGASPARRVEGSWRNVVTSSTGRTQASPAREVRKTSSTSSANFSSALALIASAKAEAAAAGEAAEAESARSIAAVQAGVGTALSAPRTGKHSKPCAFFAAGRCYYGDKCVYSHANSRDQEAEEEGGLEEEGPGGAIGLGYGEEEEEEEEDGEDEWAAKEAALDEAEMIQSRRAAATEEAAEAESARSFAAVQAGVGTALSAPRTGKGSKPCTFFAAGRCLFGDKCVYSHANFGNQEAEEEGGFEEEEEGPRGAGGAEYGGEDDEEEEDDWAAKEAALDEAERIQSRRAECGVCLEKVRDSFGILENCRHVYCLKCIKEWRQKSEDLECPQCLVPSQFVVPSATLVTDAERKELLLSEYQESLSTIPCRHFDYGVSECPFGSSCFYAHLKGDGTPAYSGRPRALLPESSSGGGGGGVGGETRREVLVQRPSFVDLTAG